MTEWTQALADEAESMWRAGKSAGAIASVLGFRTRNVVIGKINRMGLTRGDQPIAQRPPRPPRPRRIDPVHGPKDPGLLHRIMTKPEVAPMNIADQDIPKAQRRTLLELENEHCRWPLGEPHKSDFAFCGHPSADMIAGRPYCTAHTRRAFAPRAR